MASHDQTTERYFLFIDCCSTERLLPFPFTIVLRYLTLTFPQDEISMFAWLNSLEPKLSRDNSLLNLKFILSDESKRFDLVIFKF